MEAFTGRTGSLAPLFGGAGGKFPIYARKSVISRINVSRLPLMPKTVQKVRKKRTDSKKRPFFWVFWQKSEVSAQKK
jgi:hypothetical protein